MASALLSEDANEIPLEENVVVFTECEKTKLPKRPYSAASEDQLKNENNFRNDSSLKKSVEREEGDSHKQMCSNFNENKKNEGLTNGVIQCSNFIHDNKNEDFGYKNIQCLNYEQQNGSVDLGYKNNQCSHCEKMNKIEDLRNENILCSNCKQKSSEQIKNENVQHSESPDEAQRKSDLDVRNENLIFETSETLLDISNYGAKEDLTRNNLEEKEGVIMNNFDETESVIKNHFIEEGSGKKNQFGEQGSGNKNQFGEQGSGKKNQFDEKRSGKKNQFDEKGSGTKNQFDEKRSGKNNQFDEKGSGKKNQFDEKGSGKKNQFGEKGSGKKNQFDKKWSGKNNQFDEKGSGKKNQFDENGSGKKNQFDEKGSGKKNQFDEKWSGENNQFDEKGSGKINQFDEKENGKKHQFDEKGSGKKNQFDEKWSGKNNQFDEKGSGKNSQFDEKGSGKKNQFGEKGSEKKNQFDEKGSGKKNHFNEEDSVINNHFGEEESVIKNDTHMTESHHLPINSNISVDNLRQSSNSKTAEIDTIFLKEPNAQTLELSETLDLKMLSNELTSKNCNEKNPLISFNELTSKNYNEKNPIASFNELTSNNCNEMNPFASFNELTSKNCNEKNPLASFNEFILQNSHAKIENKSKSRERPKSLTLDNKHFKQFKASDYFEKSDYNLFDSLDFHKIDDYSSKFKNNLLENEYSESNCEKNAKSPQFLDGRNSNDLTFLDKFEKNRNSDGSSRNDLKSSMKNESSDGSSRNDLKSSIKNESADGSSRNDLKSSIKNESSDGSSRNDLKSSMKNESSDGFNWNESKFPDDFSTETNLNTSASEFAENNCNVLKFSNNFHEDRKSKLKTNYLLNCAENDIHMTESHHLPNNNSNQPKFEVEEDFLGLNETSSTENEALDVLLELDEVLDECLKESFNSGDFVNCSEFGDDFVNENNDEYRLNIQISLEELEGRKQEEEKTAQMLSRAVKIQELEGMARIENAQHCLRENRNYLQNTEVRRNGEPEGTSNTSERRIESSRYALERINENHEHALEGINEDSRTVSGKTEDLRKTSEEINEDSRIASERRNEDSRMTSEKRNEDSRMTSERRNEDPRIVSEKNEDSRMTSEGRNEGLRIASERRNEDSRMTSERRNEDPRTVLERNEDSRMTSEGRTEDSRTASERRNEDLRMTLEEGNEDLRIASERRNKHSRMTSERRYEVPRTVSERNKDLRITPKGRNEDSRIASERRNEDSRMTSERRNEDPRTVSERNEDSGMASERRNEDSRMTLERRNEDPRTVSERNEDPGMASERRNEDSRMTLERRNEDPRTVSERNEDSGMASERRNEDSNMTSEKKHEDSRMTSEKRNEDSRMASEKRNEDSRMASERRNADPLEENISVTERISRDFGCVESWTTDFPKRRSDDPQGRAKTFEGRNLDHHKRAANYLETTGHPREAEIVFSQTSTTDFISPKTSTDLAERDITIEECLQDLDEYLRSFDEGAFNSLSPIPYANPEYNSSPDPQITNGDTFKNLNSSNPYASHFGADTFKNLSLNPYASHNEAGDFKRLSTGAQELNSRGFCNNPVFTRDGFNCSCLTGTFNNSCSAHNNSTSVPNACVSFNNSCSTFTDPTSVPHSCGSFNGSCSNFNITADPTSVSHSCGSFNGSCSNFNITASVPNNSCGSFNNPVFARDTFKNFSCSVREASNSDGIFNNCKRHTFNGITAVPQHSNCDGAFGNSGFIRDTFNNSSSVHQASNPGGCFNNTDGSSLVPQAANCGTDVFTNRSSGFQAANCRADVCTNLSSGFQEANCKTDVFNNSSSAFQASNSSGVQVLNSGGHQKLNSGGHQRSNYEGHRVSNYEGHRVSNSGGSFNNSGFARDTFSGLNSAPPNSDFMSGICKSNLTGFSSNPNLTSAKSNGDSSTISAFMYNTSNSNAISANPTFANNESDAFTSNTFNPSAVFANNESDVSNIQRPLSSCDARSGALTRNHAYRATIGAIRCGGGEERSAPGGSRAREPDNVTSRRPGNAESSVVVEESMATGAAGGDAKRPLWLRTSMRRLQPLPLPTSNNQNINNAMDNLNPGDGSFLPPGRPISAPSRLSSSVQRSRSRDRTSRNPAGRARSSSASSRSRRPRSLSSSVSSVVSSVDSTSTPTCTPTPAQTFSNTNSSTEEANNNNNNSSNARRPCERPSRTNDMPEAESPLGQWPHSLSSTLAYIGCTLGIFNISRFAILSVHFGANFIFQFLIITFFIGLPIFTLQLCLGQQLGAGVIDMWKISPMFQGVGVSLLFFQALTGIYSIIGVSWMFVYFRDAFVTKFERYRWAEPFIYYRDDIQPPINGSYKLTETIPDYLSGIVFQRHHLVSGNTYGTIKFQPAFNLAVVWMIVFVSLSKGLRSYGKVIYVFTLLPIFGTFVLCAKLLGMMPPELINSVFPETSWNEFFINPRSWLAACQEAFLTWGMLGAAVMQIASHNKNKHLLQRDSSLIAVITVTILLLVAFLANTCVQILKVNGYSYQPDSFEKLSTYTFMRHKSDPLPPNLASTPVKYMVHNSFIVGDRINRPGYDPTSESGYQVLRFATELIPATFAILGTDQVSPFWTVLFYFILILFGIAQQLAIWHCVITGIMAIKAKVLKSWETTITFFSCACGFILGLPMTTEFGIYVVYFMDLAIGGVWWLILIVLLQIIAVFMVRGRPYSGDTLVTVLFHSNNYKCLLSWAPALLSFTWNVVLPVVLMVWCIAFFKNGNFRELFIWHHGPSLEYWPLWARQIGAMLQLLPVLAVPFIAVIQSYRYLNNGPNDILDRIQLLYRPPIGEHMDDLAVQEAAAAINNNTTNPTTNIVIEDPPPKYTPPPSYTTATGARIAKMLRQSIRRSVRRIANVLGESSGIRRNPATSSQNLNRNSEPPPPDYNAVLVEMNQNSLTGNGLGVATIHGNRLDLTTLQNNSRNGNNSSVVRNGSNLSVTRNGNHSSVTRNGNDSSVATLQSSRTGDHLTVPDFDFPDQSNNTNGRSRGDAIQRELATIATSSTGLTAADVASILRSSFRRSTIRTLRRDNNDQSMSSLSAENLIDSAAPIGETSLVLALSLSDSDNDKDGNNTSSVI